MANCHDGENLSKVGRFSDALPFRMLGVGQISPKLRLTVWKIDADAASFRHVRSNGAALNNDDYFYR